MVMGRLMSPQEKSPLKEDEEVWNRLNKRSRCLSDSLSNDENKKSKKEDMKLLDEGFQAVASSLAHLTNALNNTTAYEEHIRMKMGEEALPLSLKEVISAAVSPTPSSNGNPRDDQNVAKALASSSPNPKEKAEHLRDHLNVGNSLTCRAKVLQRQMKSLKADLCFVRERCAFLEEENSRLRDRDRVCDGDGVRPEEDDLVRLQLEVLLAEKGRLAQENANLTRENEYLHQLVEYHQLTFQEDMLGFCSELSSISPPVKRIRENDGLPRLHLGDNDVVTE